MSDDERYGTRDLTYSNWHRIHSIKRFLGEPAARRITMIDLDGLEYCNVCREVVGVIEVARDIGQSFKATVVTANLARRLGVPGLLVFYTPSNEQAVGGHPDIATFRVQVIAPLKSPEHSLAPAQFAQWLLRLHNRCPCRIATEHAA